MRNALALVSALVLVACNGADAQRGDQPGAEERDSGRASSGERRFDATGFESVSLAGHHDVVITVGAAYSVRAEGDMRDLEDLRIETRGTELHIGARSRISRSNRDEPVIVHITLPALTAASISGSGDMRIDRVQGQRFDASIAGSGDIQIAELRVAEGRFSITGSGDIKAARGEAQATHIDIAGSGDVDLSGLQSRSADISVVGSGDVGVRASETANVSIMGSGDVSVAGEARCSVSKMGPGEVRCGA